MPLNDKANYYLVFEGKIKADVEIVTVKKNLLLFFNNKQGIVEQLFKKKIILKKGLSKQKAIKYKLAFDRTGAKCIIKQNIAAKTINSPRKTHQTSQIPRKKENTDNLIHNKKTLVKTISVYQKLIWILLFLSILFFGVWVTFYLSTNKMNISQIVENISGESCNYIIDFTSKKDAHKYTSTGLSAFEPLGRWSVGKSVQLKFKLPETECKYSKITISVIGFNSKKVPIQSAKAALNGVQYGKIKTESERQQLRKFTFEIPTGLLKQDSTNNMEFKINFPTSPKSIGESSDERLLGFIFHSIELQK